MTDRPTSPPDPGRRDFFRRFAGEVVTSVGSVIGAAQALQQQSADAARDLLATGGEDEIDASTAGFRVPFLWNGDTCRVVDQRRLPDVIAERDLRGPSDALTAINEGAVVGSVAQAQVAAIVIALAADRMRNSRPYARRASIRGARNALANTRPGSAAMRAAMDRMLARFDAFGTDADGSEIAAALRDEAEAIVFEATSDHGLLVAQGLLALPTGEGEELRVLTVDSTGPMSGGQCGTALSVILAAHHEGRPVHALVAETRPGFTGSRIAAWELGQAGVPHAIVGDAAAPGCIASGEVDVVLVGADRVAANGDVIAPAGAYPLALAAAARSVPFLVCTTTTAIDPATPSGDGVTLEAARPGSLLRAAGTRVAPEGTPVRSPIQDLVRADLVTAFVTEQGTLRAPYPGALAAALEAAAARRAASPRFGALAARSRPATGVAEPTADAATPVPDAATPVPDAATPVPDAATPVPDAATPVPDAPAPAPGPGAG